MKESSKRLFGTMNDSNNEGTSARTRPVSLEAIMLRRKAKKQQLESDVVVKAKSVDLSTKNLKRIDRDASMEADLSIKRSSKHSKDLPLSNYSAKKHSDETLRKERRSHRNGHSIKETRSVSEANKDRKKSEREKHQKRADEKSKRSKSSKDAFDRTECMEPVKQLDSASKRKQQNFEDNSSGNRKSASQSPSRKQIDHREKEKEEVVSRKQEASPSGVGGYSPRKKRTEPTALPSEKKRSDKKRPKWDHAPPVVDTVPTFLPANLQMISENKVIPLNIQEVVNSLIAQPQNVLPLFPSSILPIINSVSLDSIQLTQSTRPQRSLYFENLPASVSESGLMEWLNNLMISSGVNHVKGTQPCFSCTVHEEKGQAVVELLTPEDAVAALSFNGYSFSGSVVTIRRPKDFVAVAA